MIRQRCYQFRLRPTPQQECLFRQWAGCRRLVWNHFLQRRKEHYHFTGKRLSYTALCKELTRLKQQPDFAFLNDCDAQALQQVLKDLSTAYVNFFAGRAKFPHRKSKKRTPNAFRIPQRVRLEGEEVCLPKAGLVPALLHREMEGEIKSATVKQEPSGKWSITFVSHFEAPEIEVGEPQSPIGLDAGLESFVTTSDGEKTPPPKFYRKQERKLRRAQRQHSRKKQGSRNRAKAKAKKRVAVCHAKVRNQRNGWLHKLSRKIAHQHDVVCVEDLCVSALTKTKLRGHSKSWNDVAWGTFRRQLCYKQEWQGRRLVEISRWYPSSQKCHVCHVCTKHSLSVRVWTCGHCGTLHDRDTNAAKNIEAEGLRLVTAGNAGTQNVCGTDVSLPKGEQLVLKQKPSNCEVRSPRL